MACPSHNVKKARPCLHALACQATMSYVRGQVGKA